MNNVRRLTWLAYFLFIILGMFYISQGVLIINMAKTYDISLPYLGYLLFIPALAQAIATFTNGYLLDRVNLKYEVIIGLVCVVISVLCIVSGTLPLLIAGLFPLGIGYGLLCSIPNYLIITLHPLDKFKKLNFLNFFFSIGGISGPFIVGQLLEFNVDWRIIVSLSILLFIFMFWYVGEIPFSKIKREESAGNNQEDDKDKKNAESSHALIEKQKWNYSVYLIAGAMLAYVLSEVCFSSWIVAYLKLDYGYSIVKASLGLTVFWIFITFGRFAADKIGSYLKIYQFVLASSFLAFLAYFLLFFTKHTTFIFIMVALMGLGYASLYASLFSYGMDQLKTSCPKMMSFFIICGSVGNILAMPLSSFFVNKFSIFIALCFGLVILGLVVLFIYLTLYDKSNNALENKKRRRWGAITRRTRLVMVKRKKYLENIMQTGLE
jgi:fucose permease